jgi:hypothetical protein
MNPFPKIVGILSALAAVLSGTAGHDFLVSLLGTPLTTTIIAVCGLITVLSHSLPGTGGTTNPTPSITSNLTTR